MTLRPFWWWHSDTRIAEVTSAFILWYWFFLLALYGQETLLLPPYRIMWAVLPNYYIWAAIFGIAALLQSLAMCGGYWLLRYPAAAVSMGIWVFMSVMTLLTIPVGASGGIYFVHALVMAWVLIRGPVNG